ncbi:hypothetical protein V1477_020952 [Vespula maculifrons]|uniref:Uncharacterized protein n=1 Tax=Vespula maculifrons TaxID=7453 RepID=A0ABD2AND1_VESMC
MNFPFEVGRVNRIVLFSIKNSSRKENTLTRSTQHVARGDLLSGSDLSAGAYDHLHGGGTCPRHEISLRICRWRESDHDISITRALLQPSRRARVGGVNSVELSISQ